MREKYIKLLLERCLGIKKGMALFINYNKINERFVKEVVKYAQSLGVDDIYLDTIDDYERHEYLKNSKVEDINEYGPYNASKWDEYAKKDAAFLMLCSEIPGLMKDIEAEKISKAVQISMSTKKIYKDKQLKSEIPWCIACIPNKLWAEKILPNSKRPLEKFWKVLYKICMIDKEDPIKCWNEYLDKQAKMQEKLNKLKITKLYYKNSLGTDLEIKLTERSIWASASSEKWLVNIPSYEIFTSPDRKGTNGIVYSSKPLIYNGKVIDKFYIKFKNGQVTEVKAKKGQDILEGIINDNKGANMLGEVALVDYNSPISNTNLVFESTLIDENAACHIALGSGFMECISNSKKLDEKELQKIGLNISDTHVDFMIGTSDLTIEADTNKGHIILMENGNIII